MKKTFITSLMLCSMGLAFGQNAAGGGNYISGSVYDGSGTNGTAVLSGGSLTVGAGGSWLHADAKVSTPRTSATQAEVITYTGGGTYTRTTGYDNGYAKVAAPAAAFILPIGQSTYMPLTFSAASAATVTAAWYDAGTPANATISGSTYAFQAGYYDFNSTAAGSTATLSLISGTPATSRFLGTADNGTTYTDLGVAATATVLTLPNGAYKIYVAAKLSILVNAKVFLQGAYSGSTMTTTLNSLGVLPPAQPYTAAPFGHANSALATETGKTAAFFTANPTIVDWVLIELRDATTPSTILVQRAAFVKSNGTIVDMDGSSTVNFGVPSGTSFHVAIRHRNHLAVRTATPVTVSGGTVTIDFTTGSNVYDNSGVTGNTPMRTLSTGVYGMWGGDANQNGTVSLSGPSNDQSFALSNVLGGDLGNSVDVVYSTSDANMNGTVSLSGPNNDRSWVLLNVLGGDLGDSRAQSRTVTINGSTMKAGPKKASL